MVLSKIKFNEFRGEKMKYPEMRYLLGGTGGGITFKCWCDCEGWDVTASSHEEAEKYAAMVCAQVGYTFYGCS